MFVHLSILLRMGTYTLYELRKRGCLFSFSYEFDLYGSIAYSMKTEYIFQHGVITPWSRQKEFLIQHSSFNSWKPAVKLDLGEMCKLGFYFLSAAYRCLYIYRFFTDGYVYAIRVEKTWMFVFIYLWICMVSIAYSMKTEYIFRQRSSLY
jgi:hypothetical protein